MNALARPRAVLVFAFLFLGLAISSAYNTYAHAEDVSEDDRGSVLADVVEIMESENVVLLDELAGLRESMAAIEARAAEEAGMAESFGRELDTVRASAGLTGVRGPGVIVELADAESVPAGQDPGACLIHDFDVASVVNALFVGGAEAAAVNGERVVATTAIRCAGNTILVNGRRLGNPYTITAVGDSERMAATLHEDLSVNALIETYPSYYGLTAEVSIVEELEIPAFGGSLRPEWALPLEGGE